MRPVFRSFQTTRRIERSRLLLGLALSEVSFAAYYDHPHLRPLLWSGIGLFTFGVIFFFPRKDWTLNAKRLRWASVMFAAVCIIATAMMMWFPSPHAIH